MVASLGSMNADSYHVDGVEMLYEDTGGAPAVKADSYHVGDVKALYEDSGVVAVDAESYRVDGVEMLSKDAQGDTIVKADAHEVGAVKALTKKEGGVRIGMGPPTSDEINSNGAISFKSSNMRLTTLNNDPATLIKINFSSDGADGDIVILRADTASEGVTVADDTANGNIRLADSVTLTGGERALMLLRAGSIWIPVDPTG
ncbi:MAG: hypothetical protein H7X93_03525 [Sphingomonadaceae bacterium]|nr:hypothetical protein [Sphingomonadaceae bacterium]